jgi:hypothetical protein
MWMHAAANEIHSAFLDYPNFAQFIPCNYFKAFVIWDMVQPFWNEYNLLQGKVTDVYFCGLHVHIDMSYHVGCQPMTMQSVHSKSFEIHWLVCYKKNWKK